MDDQLIKTYRSLKAINAAISNADDLENGLRQCARLLIRDLNVSFVTYWQATEEGSLLPLIWYGPYDIMQRAHSFDEGAVGKAYATQRSVCMLSCDNALDEATKSDYSNVQIGSMICVPVSSSFTNYGVLQAATDYGTNPLTSDQADVIEMAAMLCALALGKNEPLPAAWSCSEPLLCASNITREYTNGDTLTRVLKGTTFSVYENELVVLLGESGCGKSTLLNIIAGLDEPTEGTVFFGDQDHTHASEHELAKFRRNNIGMVFQDYNLIPVLSTRQNLSLIGELVDDPIELNEALELVGLGDKLNNLPRQLSGGQQQRVSIARALIKRPRIILADEPTAALDYDTSIEILQALQSANKTGCSIVLVTHNEELCRMANRVVRMRDGKVFEVFVNRHPVQPNELVW